jgi:predicted transcriptional regulator
MSGEIRGRTAALVALMAILALLLMVSVVCAEGDDGSTILFDTMNEGQKVNGSWEDNLEVTTLNIHSNSIASYSVDYAKISSSGMNWTMTNYDENQLRYIGAFNNPYNNDMVISQSNILMGGTAAPEAIVFEWKDFQDEVDVDLIETQRSDGSWNNDPGDTAYAVFSRAYRSGTIDEVSARGIDWLLDNEDKENLTWGSISDDSKAILALNSAGFDMWEEIAALMLKQRPDGSFGGIEETSWAVIALTSNLNEETMERMERAVAWLRSQEYDNNEDLANAALAEQYYEKAKRDWDPPDNTLMEERGEGNGMIPPPWMLVLSIVIISSIVLSHFLFARIEKEAVLSGVRKDLYSYIEKHPGEHQAHLTKEFGISSSSARYHLSVLEGMDHIVSHKNGKYKRFYINKNGYSKYTNGNGYKHIMSALKNVTARKIVKFLLIHPQANQKSVSNALNIHPSTVNWHAERLRDAEVLSKRKNGKEIVYSLNEDVQVRKVIGILEGSIA